MKKNENSNKNMESGLINDLKKVNILLEKYYVETNADEKRFITDDILKMSDRFIKYHAVNYILNHNLSFDALDDMCQEARIEYYKAMLKYDSDHKSKASLFTFSLRYIQKGLTRAHMDYKGISKHYWEKNSKILTYLKENGKNINNITAEEIPVIAKQLCEKEKSIKRCIADCTRIYISLNQDDDNSKESKIANESNIELSAEENDLSDEVKELFLCLEDQERVLLNLYYGFYEQFDAMKIPEISRNLGLEQNTVKKTVKKGIKHLKLLMEQEGYGDAA